MVLLSNMPYKDPIKAKEAKRRSYLKYRDRPEWRKKSNEYANAWNKTHRERINAYSRGYWKNNRARKTANEQRARWKAKHEIFNHLGNTCTQCGYNDPRALQIDHINNDGAIDRKRFKTNMAYYWALLKEIRAGIDITDRYQLLCANCNFIKMWDANGYHPYGEWFDP